MNRKREAELATIDAMLLQQDAQLEQSANQLRAHGAGIQIHVPREVLEQLGEACTGHTPPPSLTYPFAGLRA